MCSLDGPQNKVERKDFGLDVIEAMRPTKTKLRMTDRPVDCLRVEVVDGDLAGQGDRPAMATVDQSVQETRGVLAAGDAGELEILSAQEHSRMRRATKRMKLNCRAE